MATGDGLLARLPPSGPLAAVSLRAVAGAAARFGSGLVEVSARGSLQVRGLAAETVQPFAEAIASVGIVDATPAILAPPLAGLDPAERVDVRPLVAAIRDAAAESGLGPRLAPKTSVIVDGGGALHLDAVEADIRLVAVDDARFHLAVGGSAAGARSVGILPRDRAASAVLVALALLAAAGPAARGRELDPAVVAAAVGTAPGSPPILRAAAGPIGTVVLADGTSALGIGLAFGQVEAAALAALVDAAEANGATSFVPAEGRALLAIGLAGAAGPAFRDAAARLGFIVRPDDPRRSVVACAGAPACAAGLMPARAVAAAVAEAAATMLDGSVTLHLSGCAKGCAHPRPATLVLVGDEHGAGLVVDGRAGDAASHLPASPLPAAVTRLAARVKAARRPDETSADAIARLAPARLAVAVLPEPVDA
jgi:precorrin-3B synthase